jgi:hypothetical protein
MDKLSAKGLGEGDAAQKAEVVSNFRGRFALNAGVLSLINCRFECQAFR